MLQRKPRIPSRRFKRTALPFFPSLWRSGLNGLVWSDWTREEEVLAHVADGNRNRDIGRRLFISEDTVKAHMQQIMQKLGARDRTHPLTIAVRRGIIRL